MPKNIARNLTITLYLASLSHGALAEPAEASEFTDIVAKGSAALDIRYRFEGVDQKGFDKDAEASTVRTRLTLTTANYHGFTVQLEADDVTSVGPNDYNSTENGKTEYPVVADPEGTDLNQAWLQYKTSTVAAKLGRQRVVHGSQRFVGGVVWRQNEQTYDGLRALVTPINGLSVDVSYVYNVNRVFGPDDGGNPADWEGDNFLLRADYAINDNHSITGFGYMVDVEEQGGYPSSKTVNASTDTYGIEYRGRFRENLTLAAAYATQSDAGDSALDYDADYYMAEAGVEIAGIDIKAGYEVLASDNGVGFQTPLATLHKFQGWADKFVATPGEGVEDAHLSIGGKLGPVKVLAVYHDFQAESSSEDWGTEIDLVATWPVLSYLTLQAKYASFDSDNDAYSDTDKFWLTAQLKL